LITVPGDLNQPHPARCNGLGHAQPQINPMGTQNGNGPLLSQGL
jgi:hypothetical protein